MMDWQTMVATITVFAAAIWLVRRVWQIVKSGSRDGEGHVTSCGSCGKNPKAASTTPLVQLGKKSKS